MISFAFENEERHLVRGLKYFLSGELAGAGVLFFRQSRADGNPAAFAKGDDFRLIGWGGRGLPGGNLLSLLRQRKKAKKGDPRFIAPQKRGVPFGNRCIGFRFSKREAMLRETLASPRNDRPLRNSGSNGQVTKGRNLCSPSNSPRGMPLSFLRYSATLIGTASFADRLPHEQLWRVVLSIIMVALTLTGCGSNPKKPDTLKQPSTSPTKPGAYYQDDGPGDGPLPNLDKIPNAVPKTEKLHSGANRTYTVFGKTYVPNVSSAPFRQQGIASWYGRKYHGQKTSIGETYDMYAMTAAHPTLPLPCYVRVSNPANGKSVVVRVNDRGPFHSDRIIDLSYVAAAKLDFARRGSAMVIVERVFAGEREERAIPPVGVSPESRSTLAVVQMPAPVASVVTVSPVVSDSGGLFLQLAAFSSRENAEIFRARMARELDWNREPLQVSRVDNLFRVRMGPYKNREEAEVIASQVRRSHDFSPVIQQP